MILNQTYSVYAHGVFISEAIQLKHLVEKALSQLQPAQWKDMRCRIGRDVALLSHFDCEHQVQGKNSNGA